MGEKMTRFLRDFAPGGGAALILLLAGPWSATPVLADIGLTILGYLGINFILGHTSVDVIPLPKDLEEVIDAGEKTVVRIRKLAKRSRRSHVVETAGKISGTAEKIFALLRKRPENAGSVRAFLDSYLERTETILRGYVDLLEQDLHDDYEVSVAIRSVEKGLKEIAQGFRRQQKKLVSAKIFNLGVELKTFKTKMKID